MSAGVVIFAAVWCGGCGSGSPTPASAPAPGGGGPKTATNDPKLQEQLKGTWHVTSIEAAGKALPPDRVQKINLQYVFDGDKVTIHRPERPDNTYTFTLDASDPKKITINQSPTVHGLYAVEGNKLRLCLMVDENQNAGFPTELASKASPKTDLLTLERH
jgi:uncharacterized protein (TIGR03067 family)